MYTYVHTFIYSFFLYVCIFQGLVPKSQLSTEPIPYPEKVFYPGQVVKCHVLTCVPGDQRLILSFKVSIGHLGLAILHVCTTCLPTA